MHHGNPQPASLILASPEKYGTPLQCLIEPLKRTLPLAGSAT